MEDNGGSLRSRLETMLISMNRYEGTPEYLKDHFYIDLLRSMPEDRVVDSRLIAFEMDPENPPTRRTKKALKILKEKYLIWTPPAYGEAEVYEISLKGKLLLMRIEEYRGNI